MFLELLIDKEQLEWKALNSVYWKAVDTNIEVFRFIDEWKLRVNDHCINTYYKTRQEALETGTKIAGFDQICNIQPLKQINRRKFILSHQGTWLEQGITVYGKSGYWQLENMVPYKYFDFTATKSFSTRTQILDIIYSTLDTHLEDIFYQYKKDYTLFKKDSTITKRTSWWVSFIKPEIQLETIFS